MQQISIFETVGQLISLQSTIALGGRLTIMTNNRWIDRMRMASAAILILSIVMLIDLSVRGEFITEVRIWMDPSWSVIDMSLSTVMMAHMLMAKTRHGVHSVLCPDRIASGASAFVP